MEREKSYFDGGIIEYIIWIIAGTIITTLSFGILYPWAVCMVYGWKINHTVIEGKRLKFNGTGISLFANWIKWWILCVITLGIYSFWIFIAINKWKTKNITFE